APQRPFVPPPARVPPTPVRARAAAAPPAHRPPQARASVPPARAAAAPKVPPPFRPASRQPIQRFQVLPPAKIYAHAPAKRPWFGYPYAIVGAAPAFNAQAPVHGVGGGDEFLTGPGGAANVV